MKQPQFYERWGLATRIVAASLILLLLVQGAVAVAVRINIETNVRTQLTHELEFGERQWARLLKTNAEKLRDGATLLAKDFGFRQAVSSNDVDTITSALENNGARIGATVSAFLDTNLQMRALSESKEATALLPMLNRIAKPMSRGEQSSEMAYVDGKLYQFVMVPLKAPLDIGWVVMGFPVNQALANDMHALTGLHLAMLSSDGKGGGSVIVSTLPPPASQALLANEQIRELRFNDETYFVRPVATQSQVGNVRTMLLRSVDEVVAPFNRVQIALGLITLLGVLLFAVGSFVTANLVTTPLRALVAAAERLGRGEYDQPMKYSERRDEINNLAKAFDHMRVNIAAKEAAILKLAYWDTLTGLPNRARFRDAVEQAIASKTDPGHLTTTRPDRAPQTTLAVVMFDLDRFKHVNDVLGYAYGDHLLKAVAERLALQIRNDNDVIARLGGDEFAVLLTHSDTENAQIVASRIAKSFESPLAFDDHTVDLSAGIGIACWPLHAADADTLLSHAEVAMYAAKRKTTDIQLYDPAMDSSSSQTLSLLTEMRQALERGELRLFLQPKIRLADGAVTAAEALVRWQHPQRGLLGPFMFIPFAEQTGFIRQLTLWMFEEVARHWTRLQEDGQAMRIAINLSTRDLLDQDFPTRLDVLMARHNVSAQAFCLEITESAIMDDPQRAEATLNRLSERGFKLSIDDFGTGYSSLAYLKRLPVDELKIDKSFVMGMEADEDDAKIVRSTIDLAHNLSLSVVAEGVENAKILDQLRDLNCDEAQGFFMSKPVPLDDFEAWRVRWNQSRQAVSV